MKMYKCTYSDVTYLCTYVVQGSCIGPLLFLIYVNDVSEELPDSCICKLYADDVKLYSVMRTVNDYKTLHRKHLCMTLALACALATS